MPPPVPVGGLELGGAGEAEAHDDQAHAVGGGHSDQKAQGRRFPEHAADVRPEQDGNADRLRPAYDQIKIQGDAVQPAGGHGGASGGAPGGAAQVHRENGEQQHADAHQQEQIAAVGVDLPQQGVQRLILQGPGGQAQLHGVAGHGHIDVPGQHGLLGLGVVIGQGVDLIFGQGLAVDHHRLCGRRRFLRRRFRRGGGLRHRLRDGSGGSFLRDGRLRVLLIGGLVGFRGGFIRVLGLLRCFLLGFAAVLLQGFLHRLLIAVLGGRLRVLGDRLRFRNHLLLGGVPCRLIGADGLVDQGAGDVQLRRVHGAKIGEIEGLILQPDQAAGLRPGLVAGIAVEFLPLQVGQAQAVDLADLIQGVGAHVQPEGQIPVLIEIGAADAGQAVQALQLLLLRAVENGLGHGVVDHTVVRVDASFLGQIGPEAKEAVLIRVKETDTLGPVNRIEDFPVFIQEDRVGHFPHKLREAYSISLEADRLLPPQIAQRLLGSDAGVAGFADPLDVIDIHRTVSKKVDDRGILRLRLCGALVSNGLRGDQIHILPAGGVAVGGDHLRQVVIIAFQHIALGVCQGIAEQIRVIDVGQDRLRTGEALLQQILRTAAQIGARVFQSQGVGKPGVDAAGLLVYDLIHRLAVEPRLHQDIDGIGAGRGAEQRRGAQNHRQEFYCDVVSHFTSPSIL